MAYRNTGFQSMGQRTGQGHRHEVIDVEEFFKKKEEFQTRQNRSATIHVPESALGRKCTALDWLRDRSAFPDNYNFPAHYGRPQPHPPSSNHDPTTEVDLIWLFSIFNTIFFMNTLPSNTGVFRQDSSTSNLRRRVDLPERRDLIFASSSASAFVDNFKAGFERRVDHQFLPPTIRVPSSHIDLSGTEQVVPWEDQVGSLLGSMIDLFIRYYSCRKNGCWNDKYTHGQMHRGEV
ncbi:uncharacterized protein EAF01_010839 [Botrytis porri]|uniref:Uncharacterized protein n=1 Tax=Botrytis porri TaxID=87229 RepID=A0A4Z1KQJ3_9HELO|nr:uncharacterized protein EAF01_010839 [Botrytis porri]KAF7889346.1 hypothetical protein EAF01_010839 [Botrytis porri]TGO86184.1 hypothetical protein BPOR_0326g00070 [Botrytis porri]